MKNRTWIKLIGIPIIFAAVINVHAQNINYRLQGTMDHLQAPAKAYLYYSNTSGKQIDSATFNNGSFTFSGVLDQPKPAVIYISKTGAGLASSEHGYVLLYLEQGSIYVKGTGSLEFAKVSGGPINTDNNKLNTLLTNNSAELKKITKAYAALSPGQNNLKEARDSIIKKSDELITKRKAIYLAFIKSHPASMMSLFALENYERPVANFADIEPIFNMLSADIRMSAAGRKYAAEISRMKHIEIGALAPDFTITDTLGKLVSLHDYKGKYVLIDFWASWCPPCRADNPNVLKIYNAYKDKNFAIVSVSLDNVKSSWLNAVHEDHLPWTQLSDLKGYNPGGIAKLYALDGIPQNFLIGPDGRIINRASFVTDLPGKLKNLLNQ